MFLNAVYVGGASAVGKTTILRHISRKYKDAVVSKKSYESLYNANVSNFLNNKHKKSGFEYTIEEIRTMSGELASQVLKCRRHNKIYEHSNECTTLYALIHEYMTKDLTSDVILDFYQQCCLAINDFSSNKMVIIIDLTEEYFLRYEKRLHFFWNNIDYHDSEEYLTLQMVAFLAMIKKRYFFQDCTIFFIDDGKSTIFGRPDTFNIRSNIMPEINGIIAIDRKNMVNSGIVRLKHLDVDLISDCIYKKHTEFTILRDNMHVPVI